MKITILDENSNKFRRVNRIVKQNPNDRLRSFAIISPENPLGWKESSDEIFIRKYLEYIKDVVKYNKNSLLKLKDELKYNPQKYVDTIKETGDTCLRRSGLSYIKIKGKYGDVENSFLIFNLTYKDAETIARDYGQESFFYGKLNVETNVYQVGYYETYNSCVDYDLVEVTETILLLDKETADFFSKYGIKFKINLKYFGDNLSKIIDKDAFEKSLDESRTFDSRARWRKVCKQKENNERN